MQYRFRFDPLSGIRFVIMLQIKMINSVSPADQNKFFANSVYPDETAHNEPSHQDLHCSQFFFLLF